MTNKSDFNLQKPIKTSANINVAGEKILSEEHNIQDAADLRKSVVYLRDENGSYFKMQEDIYMKLQLEEMQNSVQHVTSGETHLTRKTGQAYASSTAASRTSKALIVGGEGRKSTNVRSIDLRGKKKRAISQHQKKASLVVNLNKQGVNRQGSNAKNEVITMRRDSTIQPQTN